MIRGGRKGGASPARLAPVVGELFAAAQVEAGALHHDFIGTEHILLALVDRQDDVGRALRALGLSTSSVRADTRSMVGDGPGPETVFDAEALAAIGVDLETVRSRIEAEFGAGALERSRRRRGTCGGAAFGVSPRLKQALETARKDAAERGLEMTAASVALGLAHQRDSVAARILDAHAISPEHLQAALTAGDSQP